MSRMQELNLASMPPLTGDLKSLALMPQTQRLSLAACFYDRRPQELGSETADAEAPSCLHAFYDRRPQELGSNVADVGTPAWQHAFCDRQPPEFEKRCHRCGTPS